LKDLDRFTVTGNQTKGFRKPQKKNTKQGEDMKRTGRVRRKTKETNITVRLAIDGEGGLRYFHGNPIF